ncbi:MAG TPA: ATP-grasp domain-containing protein, partial [Methyloceanibacter sp.]|nr:ATP-grasp domain-containing protein [Methyloceanibacter sp.]
IAHACRKLDDLKRGFNWKALGPALEALAEDAPSPPLGVICGAGFEDRTGLLAKIAERWPLLGNGPSVVERIKDPELFFAELSRLGIPHPRTVADPAKAGDGWLAKRQGGAGGSHIVANKAAVRRKAADRVYFQEVVEGRPVSVLFVSAGDRALVLGFSEQWAAPTKHSTWRYGGAVQPAELPAELKARLAEQADQVAAIFGLKGLGSADFLINGEDAYLLEINPRPGATLDIFDNAADPLLRIHLEAVLERRLPDGPLRLSEASAAAIVYATEPVTVSQTMVWPDWTTDRPMRGDCIDRNRPICTVSARARTKVEAKQLVSERISTVLAACAGQEGGTEWT